MKIWTDFLQKQEELLGKEIVDKWLRSFAIKQFDANNLYLETADPFQVAWFEEHVRSKTNRELLSYNGKPLKVHINANSAPLVKTKGKNTPFPSAPPPVFHRDLIDLNREWKHLILSDQNAELFQFFTHLMNGSIPLGTFNPIYIWGQGGCGKTHLLMALASFFAKQGINTLYAKTDTFTEHVISAIRTSSMHSFRASYRTCDLLLIDDVQLLASKYATQEEFFHTFNTLHAQKKQIILSANVPPSQLSLIEQRLVSRFEWGINLHLESLGIEHLKQILQKKMEELSLPLSCEMQEFLLENFSTISSLQKAIDTLCLREHIDKLPISTLTPHDAEKLLHPLLEQQKKQILSPEKIQELVCKTYEILPRELMGKSQTKECSLPRKLAIYLCRKELHMPFQKIGKLFSRDHSTIMSSVKDIEALVESKQEELLANLREIKRQMQEL